MLVIVDNGKGADQIAQFIRGAKTIIKPTAAVPANTSAIILSDGDLKNQKANEKILQSFDKPLLAIGTASLFLATVRGAKIVPGKVVKQEHVKIERPCAILLDMKRQFTVIKSCGSEIDDLPENMDVMASSKYPFEVIADDEKPFFGVHFNPELGAEGLKIIQNFIKSVEVWEKYHKAAKK
jgi:GMP synthase-like glutamine amidotransferase